MAKQPQNPARPKKQTPNTPQPKKTTPNPPKAEPLITIPKNIINRLNKLIEEINIITSYEKNQKTYKPPKPNNNNMLPGDPKGSPDESFNSTLVFIDAGFVSKLSKHFGKGKFLIYDILNFAENLAKKERLNCNQIFYYTAPPFQSNKPTKEEEKRREGYDKFIKKLKQKGILVREGRCQKLKINSKDEYHQKAVDILMAIDLMRIPSKYPKIKRIILIATDSDFVPVVQSLKESNIKVLLYTFYEKKRNTKFSRSNYLIKAVHKYILLSKPDFDNCPIK